MVDLLIILPIKLIKCRNKVKFDNLFYDLYQLFMSLLKWLTCRCWYVAFFDEALHLFSMYDMLKQDWNYKRIGKNTFTEGSAFY